MKNFIKLVSRSFGVALFCALFMTVISVLHNKYATSMSEPFRLTELLFILGAITLLIFIPQLIFNVVTELLSERKSKHVRTQ